MLKSLDKKEYDIKLIETWVGNGATLWVKRDLSGGFDIKETNENEFEKAFNIFMNHYKNNLCINTKIYQGIKEVLENI